MADRQVATDHPPQGSRAQVRWLFWLTNTLLGLSTLLNPPAISAAGKEVVSREQDIILQVDSRWPGNAYGGYFPLRIKLSNMAAPRAFTLVYEGLENSRDMQIPKVHRSVHIEQQATVNFTLSIPMVSLGAQGVVRVFGENGEELKSLSSSHALPTFGGDMPRASLLVISTDNVDDKQLEPFEDAASTEAAALAATGSSRPFAGSSPGITERDHVVIEPSQNLPVNWIDYSGVDLVAVNWPDWNSRLTAAERAAILKWTAAGGVLMIFGTEKPAAQHLELNQLLQLDRQAAQEWTACQPETNHAMTITTATGIRTGGGAHAAGVRLPWKVAGIWKTTADTFSHRDWALGEIHVFPDNPFPGSASDWAWWLSSLHRNQSQWSRKFGMSSRTRNAEFLGFLIPGIGTVPVFAFLCLITVFTLVIGPLNYYWLYKRRRLALMVLTVPFIAGVTCVVLFVYSLIADGFSIRGRVHSFTWLDQERKSAVSLSRLSLYAPFAPSNGLKFPAECAVFPIWPSSGEFEGGSVDWSANDQNLNSAWFRSQTWTQFQTVEHRDERGRLDYTPPADPKTPLLKVSNGLSWDLDYLAVRISDTQWYAGGPVPAGASAELKLTPRADIRGRFREAAEQSAWNYPEGISGDPAPFGGTPVTPGVYNNATQSEGSFIQSLLVRSSASATVDPGPWVETCDWRSAGQATQVRPHSATLRPHYWAICRSNPGVQTGVKAALDPNSLHLLFGTF